MAGLMNTVTIPCRGGLNLSSNNQELLAKPNEAIRLVNFECSKQGGYRRISGFEVLSSVLPKTGKVHGIRNYKGTVAARGDGLYHTFDDSYWVQVNKVNANNVDETALSALAEAPRTGADRYMFDTHSVNQNDYLLFVDGINNPGILKITGTERAGATYRYKEIVEGTALVGAKYCRMVRNQFVIAGMDEDPTAFYYSSLATTDLISPEDDDKEIPQENFNGSTAGSISVGSTIVGLAMQRDILYIFCEDSIFKVQGLDTGSPQVDPVTRDIGCIDGFSIQEVGGDLLFLSNDGLRTIAKTDRLGDLELGVVSRKVSKILDGYIRDKDKFRFDSTIIKEKNQYRLWFTNLLNPDLSQRGITAAYTYDANTREFAWAFSELEGLGVTCVDNHSFANKERIIHGNQNGDICVQETGITFGGSRIRYAYQSPYTDMGDISARKAIHKVFIWTRPEGEVQMGLRLRYDYESADVHQPEIYPLATITQPAIYGDSLVTYGDPLIKYGATDIPERDVYTQGSGFVVSFKIISLDTIDDASFDIQSLQVDLTGGGKV